MHLQFNKIYPFQRLNSVSRRLMRDSPRWVLIVYRLIDMALIGFFSKIPAYFRIEILANRDSAFTFGSKRVNIIQSYCHI